MLPLTEVGKVAQDDVSDECYQDLPFHSPLIVSHEVAELQALLELFEEDFNCPAAFVEIAEHAGMYLQTALRMEYLFFGWGKCGVFFTKPACSRLASEIPAYLFS